MPTRKTSITIVLLLFLAACATANADSYPSLAVRDVERAEGTFEPVQTAPLDVPPVAVDLTGGLVARLAALVAQAREAHAAFMASVPEAERRVSAASGSGVGNDSWAAAQVALADLDSARSSAAVALADLDILHTAASIQSESTAQMDAARSVVIALVAEEDATLERLRARMR